MRRNFNFGRQPLRSARLKIRVAWFAIIAMLLLALAMAGVEMGSPLRLGNIAGLLVGYCLVYYRGLLWRAHGAAPARSSQ